MSADVAVVVLAKRPVPGRVKTRMCPPLRPDQAAYIGVPVEGPYKPEHYRY